VEPTRLSKNTRGRKARVREKIIKTAAGLFKQAGFSHVSVARIAEQAGVSQVTVFNHFGNKYSLIETVVARIADEKVAEYRRILGSDAPWPERLRAVILDKHQVLHDFQGQFITTLYREYPELVKRIAEVQPRIRDEIIYPFLEEGKRRGYVPTHISKEGLNAYMGILTGGFNASKDIMDRISESPELFDEVYDIILHGLIRERGGNED